MELNVWLTGPNARLLRATSMCARYVVCSACGGSLWAAYENARTVTTLNDVCRLTLRVVRCHNRQCPRYHIPYRPEEEGAWALPHHEFGLDVIARIGGLDYREHRSVPEIHQALRDQGVAIAPGTVTDLLVRYEELLADAAHLTKRLTTQGHVILAIDGVQRDRWWCQSTQPSPMVPHESGPNNVRTVTYGC